MLPWHVGMCWTFPTLLMLWYVTFHCPLDMFKGFYMIIMSVHILQPRVISPCFFEESKWESLTTLACQRSSCDLEFADALCQVSTDYYGFKVDNFCHRYSQLKASYHLMRLESSRCFVFVVLACGVSCNCTEKHVVLLNVRIVLSNSDMMTCWAGSFLLHCHVWYLFRSTSARF